MFFGSVPLGEALGGIAAHTVRHGPLTLRKGTRLDVSTLEALRAGGLEHIVIARLDPGDVGEDEAARALAERAAGPGLVAEPAATGRSNLHASAAGLLMVDRSRLDALNGIDESVTLACLPDHAPLAPGTMAATVKIIPFAVPRTVLDRCLALLDTPVLSLAPYRPERVAVLSTLLPGLKPSTIDKTLRVTRERLAPAGARLAVERRMAHEAGALAETLRDPEVMACDLVVVFGASAVADRRDVVPAAIEAAGGTVEHLGMPVDPGNLLLLGRLDGRPVVGAPGCARSPAENGFDWVLRRLLAGLPVTPGVLAGYGVGGLLMDVVGRPQAREPEDATHGEPAVAAVLLAAGRSTRMGGPNKLLEHHAGRPLVRIAAEAALTSRADPVLVVLGHDAPRVRAALDGLPVRFVDNPAYADGLSTSVRAGIAAVPAGHAGAVVCLGDMPAVDAPLIDRLIDAFDPDHGAQAVLPVVGGRRGNPVLWGRRFFPDLLRLTGDAGARRLLDAGGDGLVEVVVDGPAATLDIDTPQALATLRGIQPAQQCGAVDFSADEP